jgi:hypothetical protein
MLPLTLIGVQGGATSGLVDSGAASNVLPYALGVQLGFDWDRQTRSVELSGNLASVEARVVVLSAVVGGFPPVRLAFAWARTDAVSVILGQVNFFLEFDVCFYRRPQSLRPPLRMLGYVSSIRCLIRAAAAMIMRLARGYLESPGRSPLERTSS